MTLSQRLVDIAKSQVGVAESKRQNSGLPYERYSLKGEAELPWCSRFVRWCLEMSGFQIPWNRYEMASVAYLQAQMKERGWLVEVPRAGDIIFFSERGKSDAGIGNHVGFIVGVGVEYLKTVEGNFGDAVRAVDHKITDPKISGFGRIPSE